MKFGKRSLDVLATLDTDLQDVLNEVIKHFDIVLIEGHRDEETQNRYYDTGKSKVRFPNSKHNSDPSKAVDVAMWHNKQPSVRWDNKFEFTFLAGVIIGIAKTKGITLRWGGDWNSDQIQNESFVDMPHFELVKE